LPQLTLIASEATMLQRCSLIGPTMRGLSVQEPADHKRPEGDLVDCSSSAVVET
jgi:hypothetical protein